MELTVKVKNVYGNDLIYPVCEKSKLICNKLLKAKTFTQSAINTLKELGYSFEVEVAVL